MLIHPWDAATDEDEAWDFVRHQGFGNLVAAGRGRDVPVLVPTQFIVVDGADGGRPAIELHLARPNPVWRAIDENPTVVFAVSGDWAYIPSAWKAVGDEDPALGIPTTYYAAVQLVARATVIDDADELLAVLRRQLGESEPTVDHADPSVHHKQLRGIRGLHLDVVEVRGKFKYGGNVDLAHRTAVADRLAERSGPGDEAARTHLLRRVTR